MSKTKVHMVTVLIVDTLSVEEQRRAAEPETLRGWTRHSSGSYWCLHCNATGDAPGDMDCANCGGLGWRYLHGKPEGAAVDYVRTIIRERDEARAETARLTAMINETGEGTFNVLALLDLYHTRAMEGEERAALAYPRALQAAAQCVLECEALIMDQKGVEITYALHDDILALTPDDIERITKEHEHG